MATKYVIYNRKTFIYKIGNKVVSAKEWWYMVKWLIINKPGCLCQDDDNLLMYSN